ncbi:hypothetical protein GCM10010467_22270 [Actinocorallia glomerata]|uniref:Uncharacterized protein n=2 Tax=Actinomycetes TaxID=1760 RepID=A0ABP6LVX5_9MICC
MVRSCGDTAGGVPRHRRWRTRRNGGLIRGRRFHVKPCDPWQSGEVRDPPEVTPVAALYTHLGVVSGGDMKRPSESRNPHRRTSEKDAGLGRGIHLCWCGPPIMSAPPAVTSFHVKRWVEGCRNDLCFGP